MTPDMSCEGYQELAPWYVADSLSSDERAEMERHLAICGRCRAALEEWRAVASAVRRADERIPSDTASLTTWANISSLLDEQADLIYKANERTTMPLQERRDPATDTSVDLPSGDSPRRRRHAIVEAVAVAALIAISIGVFGLFAAHRGASHNNGVTATHHAACAPSQATVSLPAHTDLVAIAPLGTDDGWAVGNTSDPKQPASPPVALLFHLQNCHWAPAGTPISKAVFSDISMTSQDDGWAVGAMMTLDTTPLSDGTPRNNWVWSQPLALHYTHGSWQQAPVAPGMRATVQQIKMVSAHEGWMVVYGGKGIAATNGVNHVTFAYSLFHYLNGTWTNVPISFFTPTMAVMDLDARQPGEVWLEGVDIAQDSNGNQPSFVAHYAGGVWTTHNVWVKIGVVTQSADLLTVSEVSPTDVWAGGTGLYHFDGSHWSTVPVASIQGVPSWYDTTVPPTINRVVMVSPTQGWAFGSVLYVDVRNHISKQIPFALQYDHGVWYWQTLQVPGKTLVQGLRYYASSTPSQGWGLASLQDGNAVDDNQTLLYYDAGSWGIVRQQP